MNNITRQKSSFVLLKVAIIFLACWSGEALASDVELAWDAPAWQGVAGYKLHYGTGSRKYGTSVNVVNSTSCTINSLSNGTYYFAVTAYDSNGTETGYSNEVSITISTPSTGRLPAPANVSARTKDAAALLKTKP